MKVKEGTLLRELQSIVGKKHAHEPTDERDCAVDGISPRAIVEPGSYEEVAEVLGFANAEQLAVIPRGSGFFALLGNIPSRYDISLSLTRLDKIIEHEPADMTVTCQAGVTGRALQDHLDPSHQLVPFPGDPSTVGGRLAIGEQSGHQPHGSPRDFTLGLSIVTADGRLTKAGGRVVKNVAGYDLCKLYIGSFGTLGIIVEATFKLFPLPQTNDGLELEFASIQDVAKFAIEIRRLGEALSGINVRRMLQPDGERYVPASGYVCAVSLSGSRTAVERSMTEIRALATERKATTLEREVPARDVEKPPARALAEGALTCQASVLPSHVPELVRALEDQPPGPFLELDPAVGEVTATWPGATSQANLLDRLHAIVARLGGRLVVRACSPELKREIDVFGPPPPSFPLMRAIKQQFDPNSVLSPGRFVGRL